MTTVREAWQQSRFMVDVIEELAKLRQVVSRLNCELESLRFLLDQEE